MSKLKYIYYVKRRAAMKNKHISFLAIIIALILCVITVYAAGDKVLKTELKAFKVTSKEKKETFTSCEKVKPGDIIEYRLIITNISKKQITKVSPKIPVPAETIYINNSAKPNHAFATIDGSKYIEITAVTDPQNKAKKIDPTKFKIIKWEIDQMDPNESATLKIRVKVQKPIVQQNK